MSESSREALTAGWEAFTDVWNGREALLDVREWPGGPSR